MNDPLFSLSWMYCIVIWIFFKTLIWIVRKLTKTNKSSLPSLMSKYCRSCNLGFKFCEFWKEKFDTSHGRRQTLLFWTGKEGRLFFFWIGKGRLPAVLNSEVRSDFCSYVHPKWKHPPTSAGAHEYIVRWPGLAQETLKLSRPVPYLHRSTIV